MSSAKRYGTLAFALLTLRHQTPMQTSCRTIPMRRTKSVIPTGRNRSMTDSRDGNGSSSTATSRKSPGLLTQRCSDLPPVEHYSDALHSCALPYLEVFEDVLNGASWHIEHRPAHLIQAQNSCRSICRRDAKTTGVVGRDGSKTNARDGTRRHAAAAATSRKNHGMSTQNFSGANWKES